MYIHYIYIHIIAHVHCVLSRLSHVRFFAAPLIVAQTPLPMGFSRQECWSVLPYPLSGESSQPRGQTHVSTSACIGRWILYDWRHLGSPYIYIHTNTHTH